MAERRIYTVDDFHAPDPYDELLHLPPFDRIDRLAEIEKDAKDSGYTVKLFRQRWKEYQKEHGETLRGENLTEFSGQPIQLCCGDFTANDYGISRKGDVVCSVPVFFSRRLRNIETRTEKWILSHAGYGKWEELPPMPAADFGTPQKVIALKDSGIPVDSNRAKGFVSYLTTIDEQNRDYIPIVDSVGHLGWLPDGRFYPYADGIQYDGNPEFLPMVEAVGEYTRFESEITYPTWVRTVQECRNKSMAVRLAIDTALASPLISILRISPFVCHLWGESGNGKSTTLQIAASVWGDPDQLTHSCRTTQTSLELRCGTLKNLPLIADETQMLKGNRGSGELGIYELTQGRGKERATQTFGIRETETWANTILTAGENPLVTSKSAAGEINRVLQVECKQGDDLVQDVARVKDVIASCHGIAGKDFISAIASQDKDDIRNLFKMIQRDVREVVDTSGKQVVMLSVVLLADILAEQVIFGTGEPLHAKDLIPYAVSKDELSEGLRGYESTKEFIVANLAHFPTATNPDSPIEMYGKVEGDGDVAFIKDTWEKMIREKGYTPEKVLSWMKHNEKIKCDKGKYRVQRRISGGKIDCLLLVGILSGDTQETADPT